jgi:drug/metabolite transporter (DMT)-like permease
MGALALAVHGRSMWPGARDLAWLCVASLLGVTANQALYLSGLERSSAVHAGLLMCQIPVFTFLIAVLVRQERFQLARAAGVLLALCGAAWWLLRERPELVSAHVAGDLLMVANTLCYAGYLVLSRPLAQRHPPLVVLAWVYLCALPALPLLAHGEVLLPSAAPARAWWALAYVLLFPTVLGYLFNIYALGRLRASTTAVYVYLQPMITATAGVTLLGEELTPALLVAALFVFLGIWLVSRRPPAPRGGELPRPAVNE